MEKPCRETKLLVCAATQMELATFRREQETWVTHESEPIAFSGDTAFVLTGVGIPQTLIRLLSAVQRLRPQRILNIGIAGAYPNSGLQIGDIVIGEAETYADVGFELPEEPGFRSIRDSPFGIEFYGQDLPLALDPQWTRLPNGYSVRLGRGCTVNSCSGTDRTGRLREQMFRAVFESMEGAAVAQIGQQEGIPVCEVRAISNIAAHRDMRPENIALALTNLRCYLLKCRV